MEKITASTKAKHLFNTNLSRHFNSELSEDKNRQQAKANTLFWINEILEITKRTWRPNLNKKVTVYDKYWEEVAEEVQKIN